jgi:hypothetical protein
VHIIIEIFEFDLQEFRRGHKEELKTAEGRQNIGQIER